MRSYDRIAALFFFAVGSFFALYARISLYARHVEIGSWKEPDSGFLPLWGGITLVIMSVLLLFSTFRSRESDGAISFFPVPSAWKRVLITFLSLAAYNWLLTLLGFTLTTFLFLGFLLKVVFPQSWRRTLLVAVLGAASARFLFVNFLETQLPKGLFGL